MAYFTGENCRVGIAINAFTDGCNFDGTPGTYDVQKLAPGGLTIEARNEKAPVELNNVDIQDYVVGGLYYTWTLETPMSYSYQEKWWQLALCDEEIETAGVSAPYSHTITKADKVIFGSLKVQYADQCAAENTIIQELYSNAAVTAISVSESPEGYAMLTVSGVAVSLSRSTTEASLATAQDHEFLSWRHFSPELNNGRDYRLGDISVDYSQSLTEGEFDHAGSTPATLDFVAFAGQREVGWGFDLRMDSDAYSLIEDLETLWDGDNIYAWDNGAATTANRTCTITFGDSYMNGRPRTYAELGRETCSVSMLAQDGTTPSIGIVFENARDDVS